MNASVNAGTRQRKAPLRGACVLSHIPDAATPPPHTATPHAVVADRVCRRPRVSPCPGFHPVSMSARCSGDSFFPIAIIIHVTHASCRVSRA